MDRLNYLILGYFYKLTKAFEKKYVTEKPIFLFGPWRSGTTLLQRILNTVDGVAIWGEQGPFLKGIAEAYFDMMLDRGPAFQTMSRRRNREDYFNILRTTIKDPRVWSGWSNWYGLEDFKENFRKFIKSFFAPEFSRIKHWGMKEIRYGLDDRVLEFLNEIYPYARFIFIVRNPIDTITSQLIQASHKGLVENKYIFLKKRAEKWHRQNRAYLDFHRVNKEKSYIIRYEDIISKASTGLKNLFDFLNFRISHRQYSVIDLKDGRGFSPRKKGEIILDVKETQMLKEETREISRKFGYILEDI